MGFIASVTSDSVLKKVVLATAVVVLVAVLAWFGFHNRYGQGGGRGFGHGFGPPNVTTVTVTLGEIPIEEQLPGRLTAHRVAEIRPQVGGIIEKRLFEEGSEVVAGQHLYQLDQARYLANMQSARANLAQTKAAEHVAELKANRYKKLIGTKAISQQDYDDAEATLSQARAAVSVAAAAVSTARLNLQYTQVDAPISGLIGKSMVTEGALVTANQSQPLAVVTQLDPIYLDIQQSSTGNLKLREMLSHRGDIAVTLKAEGEDKPYPLEGKLKFSDVSVDESTGSVDVRALFPNPQHLLLPGMFVTATLHLGTEKAITVPQQAVGHNLQGNAYVWVVDGKHTVHQQVVTTARSWDHKWVISRGLTPGDMLVTQGVQRLQPGIKVVPHPQETGK